MLVGDRHVHSVNTGDQYGKVRTMVNTASLFSPVVLVVAMMLANASSVLMRILV